MTEPSPSPPTDPAPSGFAALGLRDELIRTTSALGYEEPTPIQREAIPPLLAGRDLLGQAATGTGKTAAFALPVLHCIPPGAPAKPSVLVVVPTRELAVQVSEAMFKYGAQQNVRVVPIYGGQPIYRQLYALDRGVHVVVATPGRAIDHMRRGSLDFTGIRTVILDEADEMLDMGFAEDIEAILDATPADRQTVLFSATMPARIEEIARKYQRDPVRIHIGSDRSSTAKVLVRQTAYIVSRFHMASALGRVLDMEEPRSALVFCRTRTEVEELTRTLCGRGYAAEALHGGMDQNQRDRVMGRLRDGSTELLVATDVAARGLDVEALTHVVNYGVPNAAEGYVHRIGRVGRAGREGVAITLAEPRQRRLLESIERLTGQAIPIDKVPSVGDLRAKQIEVTVDAVRESMAAEDLEDYASVLHRLAGHGNERSIALATIRLFHEARGAVTDEAEIPEVPEKRRPARVERPEKTARPTGGAKAGKPTKAGKPPKAGGKAADPGPAPARRKRGNVGPGTELIFVGVGSKAGIRAGDLVGAIANETALVGRDIGPIRVAESYSVVGVPAQAADEVIAALSATKIRGRKAAIRRYTD